MNNMSFILCELFPWSRLKVNIHKSYLPPVSKAHPYVIIRTKGQRLIVSNCQPLLSEAFKPLSVAFQLLCLGIVRVIIKGPAQPFMGGELEDRPQEGNKSHLVVTRR